MPAWLIRFGPASATGHFWFPVCRVHWELKSRKTHARVLHALARERWLASRSRAAKKAAKNAKLTYRSAQLRLKVCPHPAQPPLTKQAPVDIQRAPAGGPDHRYQPDARPIPEDLPLRVSSSRRGPLHLAFTTNKPCVKSLLQRRRSVGMTFPDIPLRLQSIHTTG